VRFLSISGSNLDEFFMVRVAGLKGQQLQDVDRLSVDGMSSRQQLAAIVAEADELVESQRSVWRDLRHELAETGIEVLGSKTIDAAVTPEELAWLETHFREQIFPILTPQALDPAHPFPFMPNKGLAVMFDLVRLSDNEPIRELVMLPAPMAR
ncbi:RNA degradosome polyphosphate kinase, partial [Bradyrhizobium sp. 18BD]